MRYHNLGGALLDVGRPAEAVRSYGEAVALRPGHPQMLARLANALRQDGQLDAALECSRQRARHRCHENRWRTTTPG